MESANGAPGQARVGALRPAAVAGEAPGPAAAPLVPRGHDAPAIVRLLQFLLDATTTEMVLRRAAVGLGLLAETAWAELDGGEAADLRLSIETPDGLCHRIDVALLDANDESARGAIAGMLTLVEQVYGRVAECERLRAEAMTDPLTGLWNRRGFEPLMEQAMARAARTGEPLALVVIDVDRFKAVNDVLGHAAGDEVLRAVAGALHGGIRPTDVAARLGGDEFAILLAGADARGATTVCERIRRALRSANRLAESGVTLSFGAAELASLNRPVPGLSGAATWMAAADVALYEAKALGRDCCVCYGEAPRVIEDDATRPIVVCAS